MPLRSSLVALVALLLAVALATAWLAPRFVPGLRPPAAAAPAALPAFDRLGAWRNSPPLAAGALRGHAAAVLLWCDTDPAGLAALAIADAWHRAYAPLGVRVLAVHEPEYAFASAPSVAAGIAARLHLALPMADDTTRFFEGALGGPGDGPRLLVVDAGGRVVVDTAGDLGAGERALRDAAAHGHPGASLPPPLDVRLPGGVRTVELGAGRVEAGPLAGLSAGHDRVFTAEFRWQQGGTRWVPAPVGDWQSGATGITALRGGAANFLAIRYSASRVGVVVVPPPAGRARVWILVDDAWPATAARGEDVIAGTGGAACIEVAEPRLYWVARGEGEHVIALSPEVPGVTFASVVFTDAR